MSKLDDWLEMHPPCEDLGKCPNPRLVPGRLPGELRRHSCGCVPIPPASVFEARSCEFIDVTSVPEMVPSYILGTSCSVHKDLEAFIDRRFSVAEMQRHLEGCR